MRFAPATLLADGSRAPAPSLRQRTRCLPAALGLLGAVALALALARPAAPGVVPVGSEGLDVMLCLDASSSMQAEDLEAGRTRLEVVREAAARFVDGRADDRIGLIAFARYPEVVCPPTRDHEALRRMLLDVARVRGDGPEDATGIGASVARASEVLQQSRARSPVVILLTDGEENVALRGATDEIAPVHAAQLARRLGVRVYAIVAGTGRAEPGGRWARPDTRPVRDLAERTGGAFFTAEDAGSVARVYAEIADLERTPFLEPRRVFHDRFLGFLGLGVLLLVLGRLLEASWWRVLQ